MRYFKEFLAVLIDLSLMILLTILILVILSNSLGDRSVNPFIGGTDKPNLRLILKIFCSVTVAYFFLSWLDNWKTIGRRFFLPGKGFFVKSMLALFIDFSVILLLARALDFIISRFIYVKYFSLLAIVIFVYCLLSGLLRGRTIGKFFFGIDIEGETTDASVIHYLKREVLYKFCLGFLIPWLLFYTSGIINTFNIFINVFVLDLVVMIMYYVYKGELWWNKLSTTKKEFRQVPRLRQVVRYLLTMSVLLGLFMFIRYENNRYQDSSLKTWGFNLPLKFDEYPDNQNAKKYAEFMATRNLSPKTIFWNCLTSMILLFYVNTFMENSHSGSLLRKS